MKSINIQLAQKSKKVFRKYGSEVVDIILFGSVLRGKKDPKDIDILLVFSKEVNKDIEYELRKSLITLSSKISIISTIN